ncbi:MAG: hypothetical protein PCALPYG88_6905 [uncultured Paraburkholderia sp.]|nr:MAG: hypothetical protein PCALPYG08_7108 [uncultured Paraburkholderia sp.]CAH2941160.1 MAG: hypothetical protein PCALPYG88_6905 [uncultured Paraburkholderia sp.]
MTRARQRALTYRRPVGGCIGGSSRTPKRRSRTRSTGRASNAILTAHTAVRSANRPAMWISLVEVRAGLDLAVEAGAAPVLLLRQTPFYHADGTPRCRARLQSPYGLPSPCPVSTSRSRCVGHFREFFFARASRRLYVTPPDLRRFRPPSTPASPCTTKRFFRCVIAGDVTSHRTANKTLP